MFLILFFSLIIPFSVYLFFSNFMVNNGGFNSFPSILGLGLIIFVEVTAYPWLKSKNNGISKIRVLTGFEPIVLPFIVSVAAFILLGRYEGLFWLLMAGISINVLFISLIPVILAWYVITTIEDFKAMKNK